MFKFGDPCEIELERPPVHAIHEVIDTIGIGFKTIEEKDKIRIRCDVDTYT